jgi:hypothetical protein
VLDLPEGHAPTLPAEESRFPALDGADDRGLRVLMQIERVPLERAAFGMSFLFFGFGSRHGLSMARIGIYFGYHLLSGHFTSNIRHFVLKSLINQCGHLHSLQ